MKWVLFCSLIVVFFSCSRFGVYTSNIVGKVQAESLEFSEQLAQTEQALNPNLLVIALISEYSFSELDGRNLSFSTLKVVYTNLSLEFDFSVGPRVKEAVFYILYPGYVTRTYYFEQSLFNKNIIKYDVEMLKTEVWPDYFYFSVRPLLLSFLSNPDYRLSVYDQAIIRSWLDKNSID